MQRCLDEVRDRGRATVWLGVWERNARAIAFYTRWQFADVGSHSFLLGTDRQTDRVMARSVVGRER
jgi:ribosomal protein S18 acetylase RimI-like enzyme